MPHYLFHMEDGIGAPTETVEAVDVGAARDMAIQFIAQHLQDQRRQFWQRGEWELIVSNEEGLTLFSIHVLANEAPSLHITAVPTSTP